MDTKHLTITIVLRTSFNQLILAFADLRVQIGFNYIHVTPVIAAILKTYDNSKVELFCLEFLIALSIPFPYSISLDIWMLCYCLCQCSVDEHVHIRWKFRWNFSWGAWLWALVSWRGHWPVLCVMNQTLSKDTTAGPSPAALKGLLQLNILLTASM